MLIGKYGYESGNNMKEVTEKIKETKLDFILILPWNLKDEVIEQLKFIREWGGKFVTTIPKVKIY
jgi:hypothetical protein